MVDQPIRWKRAAIEGLVIVASILLAFAIDASWDRHQAQSAVRAHLEALALEVDALRQLAEGGVIRRQSRMAAMRELLDQMGEGRQTISSDSINALVGELWGAWDPLPPLAALDNLHESGVFPEIRSDELRLGLARVEGAIETAALHDERVMRAWEEGLRPYLVANSDARPQVSSRRRVLPDYQTRFTTDPSHLLRDVTFQNHLIARMNRTVEALTRGETLVLELSNVADLIRRELEL